MASAPSSESVEDRPEDHTGPIAKKETQSLLREGIAFFQAGEEARALARFKKAYVLSGCLGEPHTRAMCLFNLGATYVATGQAGKGLKCLKKAGRETRERDTSLYFNLATAYDNLGEPRRAVEFYRKALRGYSASQGRGVGDTLVKLSYSLVSLGEAPSAAHSFLLAGQTYQRLQLPEEAAMAFREAANYFLRSPEYSQDEVLGALRACGQWCARITNQNLRGKLYNDLGLHYAQTGLFRLAERYFHEALQLCRRDDVLWQKRAVLLQNLGAVYNALEQFERALSFHSEAADIYGALGASQRTAQAQCLYNLATAHVQLKNYISAEFYYQQTQKAFAETGDSSGEALTCEALGATHFSQGHLDQAMPYYKQALKLFGKAKETPEVHQEQIREKLAAIADCLADPPCPVSPADGLVD